MKERKTHYSLDELVEIIEDPGKDACVAIMLNGIIYALKDLKDDVISLSEDITCLHENIDRLYDEL